MVGGLGLNAEGTRNAIARLPGPVTLGFAPYGAATRGASGGSPAGRTRDLLQAPMEDFSDSADDPGPHTLKTSASEATTSTRCTG